MSAKEDEITVTLPNSLTFFWDNLPAYKYMNYSKLYHMIFPKDSSSEQVCY